MRRFGSTASEGSKAMAELIRRAAARTRLGTMSPNPSLFYLEESLL